MGAAGESDRELLATVQRAHREVGVWCAYFSAFHPIAHSPLAEQPAEDPTRTLRHYQSDFLIRDYGFSFAELPFDAEGFAATRQNTQAGVSRAAPR